MLNKNDVVRATDLSGLERDIGLTMGRGVRHKGYGQIVNISNVQGEVPTGTDLANAQRLLNIAKAHQTGTAAGFGANLNLPTKDTPLTAEDINRFLRASLEVYEKSLNYSPFSMTVTSTQLTSSRSTRWGPRTTITSEIDAVWNSEDEARWFFNSGGEIRSSYNHPEVGTRQDRAWNRALGRVGTIRFAALSTSATNTKGEVIRSVGYYGLTNDFTRIFDGTDLDDTFDYLDNRRPGGYGYKDDFYVYVKKIPNGCRFKIEMREQNNEINKPGTAASFFTQYASKFLINPTIKLPKYTISKRF